MNVLVLNGPNMNLLGEREPAIYGSLSLSGLEAAVRTRAEEHRICVRFVQSNHEGILIDTLHEARGWADAILFNPGAYTHYAWALRDAVAAIHPPVYEVHLSDTAAREAWRRVSVLEDVRAGLYAGRGVDSYLDALEAARATRASIGDPSTSSG